MKSNHRLHTSIQLIITALALAGLVSCSEIQYSNKETRLVQSRPIVQATNSSGGSDEAEDTRPESETGVRAPITGRFFYADFEQGSVDGEYYLTCRVGSQKQKMRMWATTSEHAFAVITTGCSKCNVDPKFDLSKSSSARDSGQVAAEDLVQFSQRDLSSNTFTGRYYTERVDFVHMDHETVLNPFMLAVTEARDSFQSAAEGYVGLAPPYSLRDKQTSILAQAKESGKIDHMIFALYTNLDKNVKSNIKFGSYDQSGIQAGGQLTYMKTKSPASWELLGYNIVMHWDEVRRGPTPKVVLIEPQIPYMYIPAEDFSGYVTAALRTFSSDGVICTTDYCFFDKRCSDVDGSAIREKQMRVGIFYPGRRAFYLKIEGDKLFIPGDEVGMPADRCVLSVFRQTQGRKDAWYLGNIVLADYYIVFDLTPQAEYGQDFIQVGFAPMNTAGITYQVQPKEVIAGPTTPTAGSTGEGQAESSGGGGGAVAAVVVILILAAIAGVLYYLYRKRKQSQEVDEEEDDAETQTERRREKLLGKDKKKNKKDDAEADEEHDDRHDRDDDDEIDNKPTTNRNESTNSVANKYALNATIDDSRNGSEASRADSEVN